MDSFRFRFANVSFEYLAWTSNLRNFVDVVNLKSFSWMQRQRQHLYDLQHFILRLARLARPLLK